VKRFCLRRVAHLTMAFLPAALTACSPDSTARGAPPAGSPATAWTVDDSAVLRIGETDADPLVMVTGAVSLPGGGVAIADAGARGVYVFDAHGRRVRTLGREGRGPGEFTHPSWLGLRGDTLRVWDMVQARLTLFDTAGTLIRTEPPITDLGSFPRVAGEFADGSLLLLGTASEAWRMGAFRDSLLLVRVNLPQGTRDTLGTVPGDEQFGSRSADGRVSETTTLPFGRRTVVAVRGERIYVGSGVTPNIESSMDGRAWSKAASLPPGRRRVTRDDIDAYWARLITRGARGGSGRTPPEGLTYPSEYPPYNDLVAAADGDLWVGTPSRPGEWSHGARWMVFAPDATLRGTVLVPGRSRVLEIGKGWILVAETDADDRQLVSRYRLSPLTLPQPSEP
jgi:hypothetical protein